MKRFLPRTLFARMVLVLLGGLIVAQFLSLAVHWRERGEFVMRSAGLNSAERIAEIILGGHDHVGEALILGQLFNQPKNGWKVRLRCSLDASRWNCALR